MCCIHQHHFSNHVSFSTFHPRSEKFSITMRKSKRNLKRRSTFIKRKGSRKSNEMKCCVYLAFVWHRLDTHNFNVLHFLAVHSIFILSPRSLLLIPPQQHEKWNQTHRKYSEIKCEVLYFSIKLALSQFQKRKKTEKNDCDIKVRGIKIENRANDGAYENNYVAPRDFRPESLKKTPLWAIF